MQWASCPNADCLAPLARVVHETFGIKRWFNDYSSRNHSNSKKLLMAQPAKDWHGGRGASQNIILHLPVQQSSGQVPALNSVN